MNLEPRHYGLLTEIFNSVEKRGGLPNNKVTQILKYLSEYSTGYVRSHSAPEESDFKQAIKLLLEVVEMERVRNPSAYLLSNKDWALIIDGLVLLTISNPPTLRALNKKEVAHVKKIINNTVFTSQGGVGQLSGQHNGVQTSVFETNGNRRMFLLKIQNQPRPLRVIEVDSGTTQHYMCENYPAEHSLYFLKGYADA